MVASIVIERPKAIFHIERGLARAPICYLAGPRQSGKTTLARHFLAPGNSAYFDLEDPETESRLSALKLALNQDCPLTVIDEVQKRPELFPLLRVLADDPGRKTRYLILGSAAPHVLRGVSESLAGRVELVELGGFTPAEVGAEKLETLGLRGGLPLSFLASSDEDSLAWRKQFLNLLAEKDIPMLGTGLPAAVLLRLLSMVAHYHGQVWSAAEPARSLGLSESRIRTLIDYFEGLYLIRILRPWHENLAKRQVKSPKLYVRDPGLLNALLGIRSAGDLYAHPKSGASWEGFAIEHLLRQVEHDEAWFWATHNGAELDLLVMKEGRRYGFEFKLSSSPRASSSMRIALADLGLELLWVVHPGKGRWPLEERIEALSLRELLSWDALP